MQANYDVNFNTDANAKYKYGFIGTEWDQGGCIGPSGQRTGPASVREAMQLAWGYVRDNRIFDIESNRVVDLNDMMIKDFGNIDDYIVTDWEYSNDLSLIHILPLCRAAEASSVCTPQPATMVTSAPSPTKKSL